MAKMASLHAALTDLPDEALNWMQGFYRGKEEGSITAIEQIVHLLEDPQHHDYSNYGEHYEPQCQTCQNITLIKKVFNV